MVESPATTRSYTWPYSLETSFNLTEVSRTYKYKDYVEVVINRPIEMTVTPLGHSIRTADGKLYELPLGWLYIEIFESTTPVKE